MKSNALKLAPLLALAAGLLLAGCISYESYSLKVDLSAGTVDLTYRNLASTELKERGDKDSVESDWNSLKGMLKGDIETKNGLTKIQSRLFEDKGTLCGGMTCRFTKRDAPLEKRLAILDKQLEGEASLRVVDGMIVLLNKEGKEVVSTNGKTVDFPNKQIMVTWPLGAKILEVTFRGNSTRSLLPYYLKEQK